MRNCYIVVAKMDDGSAFELPDLVNFEVAELVPGHAWVVSSPTELSARAVAKEFGLASGGKANAMGIVQAATGYWGVADSSLWDFMEPVERHDLVVGA